MKNNYRLSLSSLIEQARQVCVAGRDDDLKLKLEHIEAIRPGALGDHDAVREIVQKLKIAALARTKAEDTSGGKA